MENKLEEIVGTYVEGLREKLKTGQAREHAYRSVFEKFILALDIQAHPLNEPKRSKVGAPDFAFTHSDLILGYAETKDLGADLDRVEKSEQMERYLVGYSNLILTDYLEFRFFKNGTKYGDLIRIGTLSGERILPNQKVFSELVGALQDFLTSPPERIKSGKRLAKIMGGKARRIRDNVKRFLAETADTDTDILRIYESVKKMLVHDLTPETFADMYAQTLVYGLFVARYHDESADTFTRVEARDLVPESNPFLRQFFNHIAGPDFNKRLTYIVDELCAVFAVSDVRGIIDEYFEKNGMTAGQDPIIHFYEDFLKEYDAQLRKKMGAYYTPLPVVRFIVRAVDSILQKEFGLADGLADTTKLPDGRHKVQVLDPAVGTGTFISAVIRTIYERTLKKNQQGTWTTYVHRELLPRIHGFELMMAAYVIAHLKLSIEFKRSGFTMFFKRLGIYLTNSLEQAGPQRDLLSLGLSQSIAEEAKQASVIKNETPIMVVIGNPPYSAVSSNETPYANELVAKYKVEPGGHTKLQERKHWLNDDYVKFIAFAEDMIAKNGEGVVAMITNNGYLDNPTFRGMRWQLATTFDKIYILDLHGNSKKKEKAPDGGKDENVFDIQQGVGIIVAVKTGKKLPEGPAEVYHADLYGERSKKFELLETEPIWSELELDEKMFYFVPKNVTGRGKYDKGIKLSELFVENVTGIVTMGDNFIVDENKEIIAGRVQRLAHGEYAEEALNREFGLGKNYAKWVTANQQAMQFDESKLVKLAYRPFDERWTYFDNKVLWRWREKIMRHFIGHENIGLVTTRLQKENPGAFITSNIIAHKVFNAYDSNSIFPLYLYTEDGSRVPNLKKEIVAGIEKVVGKTRPADIFDYIYALLHSPSYREKYKEFLKTDFPRVPYPPGKEQFGLLVALGRELRGLHLFESPKVRQIVTTYPEDGSNIVEKVQREDDRVYINKAQYFGEVSDIAWNFWIGGYQPAQKWLKDRKGRKLTADDLMHYQKIIKALVETDRLMKKIDAVTREWI